ncbi:hypothetical protein Golax_010783 [Gossypium laxum]|uniref:Uncharacterized protein n=2 Tax=Gossypium TaxID=3633 RepID=A0A7J8X5T1_GOSAI|nr:hypothetical protein [Gossypium aridum]MBA0711621.1 hypothetical protein [Gossypium laxum]
MSTQTQQQPVVVYPTSVSTQAPPSHSSHSGGSFTTVFIVVAVIIVASAISCFLGRFCGRRMNQRKPSPKHKQSRDLRRPEKGDIEFGSDGRINASATAKPGDHGEPSKGLDIKMPLSEHGDPAGIGIGMPGNGYVREFRVSEHGDPAGFGVPGNGYPELRIPENGITAGFRMHGNGEPMEFRMPGHGHNGENKAC